MIRGLCRTMTLFSTSFVVAPHCTAGMPFAIGIPLGEMGVSNAKASISDNRPSKILRLQKHNKR
jgi:hypothetical protein